MKCGAQLPAQGECGVCHGKGLSAAVPSMLDRDLNLDRRSRPTPTPPAFPAAAAPPPRTAPPVPPPSRAAPPVPPPSRAAPPAPRTSAAAPAREETPGRNTLAAPAEDGVVELHAAPASLWRRALAFFVDAAIIGAILGVYLAIAAAVVGPARTHLTGLDYWMARARELEAALIPGLILAAILALTYSAASGFLWNGRTLGRRLLGIQLVDKSGLAPAPARAIVRAVLAVFSFALFLAGFWLALFDRRGQTLHDKLTSTFVVRPV